ncbi:MAG: hypothetical protein RRB13_11240 [bacterium]|nr:hypothetical protein [bacterium]
MNNQTLIEENLTLYLQGLAEAIAEGLVEATGGKLEARAFGPGVKSLASKATELYHTWTNNWVNPYCKRSELAAVLVAVLYNSKPMIQAKLPPERLGSLQRASSVFAFASVMGMYVKLAGSSPQLYNQFVTRFNRQIAQAFARDSKWPVEGIHRFIEKNFQVMPNTVFFEALPED